MYRSRGGSLPSALVGAALALLLGARAAAAEDLPKLKRFFDLDAQHADYVLVIDTSGSMKRLWSAVVRGAEVFIEAVPDGEHVSLVFFDTEASASRVLPRTLSGANRGDLLRELRALAAPSGRHTDLGSALEKTVAELVRPGANQLQFVFFLSDFSHDPAAASPFAARDPSAASWRDLAGRFALGRGERLLQTFALLLPLGGDVGRDLRLVESVLGRLEAVSVGSPATLEEWFRRRRAEIERDKLRVLVRAEALRGGSVEVVSRGRENLLVVDWRATTLPVSAAIESLQATSLGSRFSREPVVIAPGERIEIPFEIFRIAPRDLLSRLLITRLRTRQPLSVEGTVRLTLEPAEEVGLLAGTGASAAAAFRVEPESRVPFASGTPLFVLQEGTHPLVQAGLVVAAVALATFFWRRWLRPEWTFGKRAVLLEAYLDGTAVGGEIRLAPSRRPLSFAIDPSEAAAALSRETHGARPGPEPPEFRLEFHPRRPRFPFATPRRGTYCLSQSGEPVNHFAAGDRERSEIVPERLRPRQSPIDPRRTHTFELAFSRGTRQHVFRIDVRST